MKGNRILRALRASARSCLLICWLSAALALSAARAAAQGQAAANMVPALMVSDIHFEPFWDPGKTPELAAAPIARWDAILASAPSPDRGERFAALQQRCRARGVDTSYSLLASSLRAMREHAADARFITLSGDLMSHDFSCKYAAVFPHAAPGDYRAFAAKTVEYVLAELRGAFPGVPLYPALGNNDSGCEDYRLDAHGAFLSSLAPSMTADVPAAQRGTAMRDFAAGGYYSVSLPSPVGSARLLVMDDLFMAARYATCRGNPDPGPAAAQIAWLRGQLVLARRGHEKIWFLSHIPPGIDPYTTVARMRNPCGSAPAMFLSSGALPDTLADFGDVIKLAIFAHTHMDEIRLLEPAHASAQSSTRPGVAVKMVPSISPVDGNNPSFIVARVDPSSAILADYAVIAASNKTGLDTTWTKEYDFDQTYGQTAFSARPVASLIAGFASDPAAQTESSQAYLRNYFVRDLSLVLKAFWPQYVCALQNDSAAGYSVCSCHSAP